MTSRSTQWNRDNPDAYAEHQRRFDEANPGKRAEYSRKSREKLKDDPEAKARRAKHRADSYARHAEKRRADARQRKLDKREYYTELENKRRTLAKAAFREHVPRETLYAFDVGRCYLCDKSLGQSWHQEHLIPLSRGGLNERKNMAASCLPCNSSKRNKLPHELPASMGRRVWSRLWELQGILDT